MRARRRIWLSAGAVLQLCCAGSLAAETSAAASLATDMTSLLEPIREKHKLPALAAAVVIDGEVAAQGVVGVRKLDSPEIATISDKFHLGSCTKAMTATLLGTLIDEGKLRWDSTLGDVFPEHRGEINEAYTSVTVEQLLNHRGGFPGETAPPGKSLRDIHALPGTECEQRMAYIRMMWKARPEAPPGTRYIYSNAGYTVAGAIAEKVAGTPYAELVETRVFRPLGINSAGFGAMGTVGKVDQPWPHIHQFGMRVPVEPGPRSDNPAAITPAGRVHCSIGDWAKFAAAHACGETMGGLLKPETYKRLHTPAQDQDYVGGWAVVNRPWGGGRVLTHAGSNTMNYAVVWVAPARRFAVVIATNIDDAHAACDTVAGACIKKYLPPR
ncbi:MAG: serine hydrolase domain-containing protein [Candidatus Sumerlaeaceae bacterium]